MNALVSSFLWVGLLSITRTTAFAPSSPTSFLVSQNRVTSSNNAVKNKLPTKGWLSSSPLLGLKMANDGEDSSEPQQQAPQNDTSVNTQMKNVETLKSHLNVYEDTPSSFVKSKPMSVVMKFGGSSIANADRINEVSYLIKNQIELGYQPRAVVCSAMGKTTNTLLTAGEFALGGKVNVDALRTLHTAAINEFNLSNNTRDEITNLLDECEDMLNGVRLLQELSPKSLDQLVSYGERCSVRIIAARLNQIGVPAQAFDAWEVGIHTTDVFGDATLLDTTEANIAATFRDKIDPNIVAVVTGFIGKEPKQGRITTLGRGGSDLTATAIGAACGLDEIQVWKDVDGILSTDPRIVKNAIPIDQVSFEEARELAYFGAQVLHPIAMQPAMLRNVPVRVKNSYNPAAKGTVIKKLDRPLRLVTAITCKRGVQLVDIVSTRMLGAYGFLSTVFESFERNQLSVDVLASSEVSISLTLDKKQKQESLSNLIEDLQKYAEIVVAEDRAILTLIADVNRSSDVLATAFSVFSARDIKVEMLSQGASKTNISFVLRDDQLEDAIIHLHSCFFEGMCIVGAPDDIVLEEEEEISVSPWPSKV